MATGPGVPAVGNVFVPPDLSGRVRVGFSRNPKKFLLPNYVQMVEVPNVSAYWLKLTSAQAARVVDTGDFAWPDAQPDPLNSQDLESFNFQPLLTKRYRYPFRIGQRTAQQAAWPIVEQNTQIQAARCMTARTIRVLAKATDPNQWLQTADPENTSADHTATAATISGGGQWDQGTPDLPYIKIGLGYIADLVNRDTLGVVDSDPEKFWTIINPTTARLLAKTSEIHKYIANSVWAMSEIQTGQHPNGKYGLPSSLYGVKLAIENAVRVTTQRGVTQSRSYVLPTGTALVVSRVGELEGTYGAPSFSTLTVFWYQDEMTIELNSSSWDRLTMGRVVEDTDEQVTCPASGFLVTNCCNVPASGSGV